MDKIKELDIAYRYAKLTRALKNTIEGEFCKMCNAKSLRELEKMMFFIKNNLDNLYKLKLDELIEINNIKLK